MQRDSREIDMTRTVFHSNEDAACGVCDAVAFMDANALEKWYIHE